MRYLLTFFSHICFACLPILLLGPDLASAETLIEVHKGKRELHYYENNLLIKTFPIGLGFAPEGDKEVEGDGRTPEGEFYVTVKNPRSSFYLSLGISYPNKEDALRGLRADLVSQWTYQRIIKSVERGSTPPQKSALGGEIFIHGNGSQGDWTLGCIALDNQAMAVLFAAVNVGDRIVIYP